MLSRRLLSALTLATFVALPAYASAADPKAEAAKLAVDGRKALKEKRFDDAAEALKRSVDLDPNPQTRLDLAEALAADGQLLEASRALHAVADAPPSPATTKLQETAKKNLAAIEPRIPWLQIDVVGPEEDAVTVKVDGKQVDISGEVPLNPGDHKIVATADGFETAKKRVSLEEGVHEKKKIKMKKSGGGKAAAKDDDEGGGKAAAKDDEGGGDSGGGSGPKQKDKVSDSGSSSGLPKMPLVISALGLGGVGLIAGSIAGGIAIKKKGDAQKNCVGNKCMPVARADIDASKTAGNVSTAFFIIGGVGAAAGVALYFFLPDNKPAAYAPVKPAKDSTDEEPAEPTEKKKKKKNTEEQDPETDAFIAPYMGLGQLGVMGRF